MAHDSRRDPDTAKRGKNGTVHTWRVKKIKNKKEKPRCRRQGKMLFEKRKKKYCFYPGVNFPETFVWNNSFVSYVIDSQWETVKEGLQFWALCHYNTRTADLDINSQWGKTLPTPPQRHSKYFTWNGNNINCIKLNFVLEKEWARERRRERLRDREGGDAWETTSIYFSCL